METNKEHPWTSDPEEALRKAMAYTTIRVSNETWTLINNEKKLGESMEDSLLRLIRVFKVETR